MLRIFITILLSKGVYGTHFTQTSGYMTSPSYPNHAGHYVTSTHVVDTGSILISLKFEVINTEVGRDVVKVYDRHGNELYSASGIQDPYVLKSDTYYRVVYETDVSIDSVGYYASWRIAPSTFLGQVPPFTFSCGSSIFEKTFSLNLPLSCNEIFYSPDFNECRNVCANDNGCKAFQFVAGTCTSFCYGSTSNSRESMVWLRQ